MDKNEWRSLDATQEFMTKLELDLDEIKNQWSCGVFTSENEHQTIQLNSRAIGKIQALEDILEWIRRDDAETESNGVSGTD